MSSKVRLQACFVADLRELRMNLPLRHQSKAHVFLRVALRGSVTLWRDGIRDLNTHFHHHPMILDITALAFTPLDSRAQMRDKPF